MTFDIERYIAELKKRESIWCPFCGEEYEDEGHCVTYGGDKATEVQCGSCGEDFEVHETVLRTYETNKISTNSKSD